MTDPRRGLDERVLVIKLGALGDMVQATAPFHAIRDHHPDARITLLTTAPYAEFAAASGWFDTVWAGGRARNIAAWWTLLRRLRGGVFDWVYDLQTSDRTAIYYRLMRGRPRWNGIVRGCSHPHTDPARDVLHTLQRQVGQLAIAGIARVPDPDLSWAAADVSEFDLPAAYAVFAVGGSASRPDKRWPAASYADLARRLSSRAVTPVLVGTAEDADAARTVVAACPGAIDLLGRTSLLQLATISRAATAAIGNDTGPIHVAAATGAPTTVLFSAASDPALCAPAGAGVTILRADPLSALSVDKVEAALRLR